MALPSDTAAVTSRLHVVRTTVAATVSLLIAHAFTLPEPYWATISTIVVTQSSLVATWNLSWRRFAGTAMGAAVGAVLGSLFPPSVWLFSTAVLGSGMLCLLLRLDRVAYRFTAITLAIVILASHARHAWITAAHRFAEVSIGIVIGLAVTALWPEPPSASTPGAATPPS